MLIRDLLYYNGNKLPFAAAQVGQSYRNEISPRAGLLRVREFTQAEIEHFLDPAKKDHPKFDSISSMIPLLFSQALQNSVEKVPERMSFKEAVSKGIIANETLAYFMGRTYDFLEKIGINPDRMRFRQHLEHEVCVSHTNICGYGICVENPIRRSITAGGRSHITQRMT